MGGTRGSGLGVAMRTVYRAVWIVLFAGAVVWTGYGSVRRELSTQRTQRAGAELGMATFLNYTADGLLVGPLGVDGARIRYRVGDLLVAIDGVPLPPDRDARVGALSGPAGSVARETIRGPDGRYRTIRVTRDPDRMRRISIASGISFPHEFEPGHQIWTFTPASSVRS